MQLEKNLSEIMPFLDDAGHLTQLPAKHKKKLIAIWYLAGKIENGRKYTEPEIDDLLDEWAVFRDHATLRRELYNKHLINRTADCRKYWKEDDTPTLEEFVAHYV